MKFLKQLALLLLCVSSYKFSYTQENIDSNQVLAKINAINTELNLAKHKNDTLNMARNYIFLANFYKHLGLDSEAIRNYHQAQDIYLKKDTLYVYANNKIASIHLHLKQYDKALEYSQRSISIGNLIPYQKGLASASAIIGSVYEKQGHYDKALNYQKQSLIIFETLSDSTGIALTNENIGSIYEDLEQFDLAYKYFTKAYNFETDSTTNLKINIINNLSDVNRKQKKYKQALELTQRALQLARQEHNKQQEESALKDLARTYAELQHFEKAYTYLNQQKTIQEQALKNQNMQLVSAMEVLYNVKEKEAQVAILNKQNKISETRQIAIALISIAIIIVFVVWLIHLKKRKKQEQKLLKYKQKLLQADLNIKTAQEASLKREIDIKISALTNYSLNLAHKNKLLADVSRTLNNLKTRNGDFVKTKLPNIIKDINSDLSKENEWTELMAYFSQINPNFFTTLKEQVHEELTSSEMRLCMLLRLNLSSKAIASILNITPDSVRIARYRMRKKLPITSKNDLQAYILNL
ncbi:tetratricopeptide repeat protein [Algibacter amylolyticus]|uniref:Tetratricopeptide repeat protein n=1 Tax=Algibacter amylolyticus TaxID=1608400 RepID=A0A5M7BFU0_9FLAO|nr:tetratricopeptide repeat protein [Algibacter amylolyticus]KAA5827823.1 tetratricopeptide repeat protein [Algibacter amylolyticus]MBB5267052.1 tetratricopeptide (TPR) repeat protein [Algibacter amylolyticus]TSJ82068.1 tetratricopeptide repeat protein [Algibacter amylolyticus]